MKNIKKEHRTIQVINHFFVCHPEINSPIFNVVESKIDDDGYYHYSGSYVFNGFIQSFDRYGKFDNDNNLINDFTHESAKYLT